MNWVDKVAFIVAAIFFIALLAAFALSLDKHTFAMEEKEKYSKTKEQVGSENIDESGIKPTAPSIKENTKRHVFVPFSCNHDILVCKHCGSPEPKTEECPGSNKSSLCVVDKIEAYALYGHDFYCRTHGWPTDNAHRCESPFKNR